VTFNPQLQPTSLNPSAPSFLPPTQQTVTGTKRKKNSTPHNNTLDVELKSFKIELSYAKARIADLENQVNDKEQSIKIYLSKINILEADRNRTYHDQYFPQENPSTSGSWPS